MLSRRKEILEVLEANTAALALVERALDRPRAGWEFDLSGGLLAGNYSEVNECHPVARLLCAAAVHAHDGGDDRRTLELLSDSARASEALDAFPSLLGHLLSLVAVETLTKAVEQIAPTLEIDSRVSAAPRAGACSREAVLRLIERLDRDQQWRDSFRTGMLVERGATVEGLLLCTGRRRSAGQRASLPGVACPAPVLWWLLPLLEYDGVHALGVTTQWVRMAEVSDLPNARMLRPEVPDVGAAWGRAAHFASYFLVPSFYGLYETRFQKVAQARMARVRLALRLYEVDYGEPPETLEALVPDYLRSIPDDPLLGGGKLIGYVPSGDDAGLFAGMPSDLQAQGVKRYSVRLRLWPGGKD